MSSSELFIGLMSGTSIDGVDGVLADFSGARPRVIAHAATPFDAALRAELAALNTRGGADELHRAAIAANALTAVYADAVAELLATAGVGASAVAAIGAHGQTVRHRPGEFDGAGYTTQINSPALLAERCSIAVVADFRSRDVAAGGQGAPLVPAFHAGWFGQPGTDVAALNLGGISNLTLLPGKAGGDVLGFDCGPANGLMDLWCERHRGQPFDANGAWAATGHADAALLAHLLTEPYFAKPPPKSTGRDLFNAAWLDAKLASLPAQRRPEDVQATLCALTATCCANDLKRWLPGCRVLNACGGGALNGELMRRLAEALPGVAVQSSEATGLPPQQVEATAFAWLARQALRGLPGNLPSVTGAAGPRVLGAIYPA